MAQVERTRPPRRYPLTSSVQVLVGVGSLLGLLAVGLGVAVFLIASYQSDATGVANRHVQYSELIHEAALASEAVESDYRGYLLSGDSEYVSEVRAHTVEARSAFELAADYAVGKSQGDAVVMARVGFERWLRALNQDLVAYGRGDREKAIDASLGSTRQLWKAYEAPLDRAHELSERAVESSTDSLSSSASRSITILLIYFAIALIVGIGVALWVVRAIVRPALMLSQNAIEVLTQGEVLVEEDDRGSHHAVSVLVPVAVVNALADSALETRERMRPGSTPS